MATSEALNIITGHTGTAHVSSADDAAIWRGFVGNDKITLFTDQQLSLDYQTKGFLAVSDGVLCIGGRMGRISNGKTVEYSLPSSGYYRRTLLVAQYRIANDIESMWLMTMQSDPASDATTAGAAAALSISTNATNDYILYDFVCNNDGVVTGTMKTKLTVMDTIPILREAINAEETARANSVNSLSYDINSVNQDRKVHEYNGQKTSIDTTEAYFSFENNASTILNASKIAVIKLWQLNEIGVKSAVCIWVRSSNIESYWRTAPVIMTVNGNETLVVFQIRLPTSGTNSGSLACRCVTEQNGIPIISSHNIPFDRATIFAWMP